VLINGHAAVLGKGSPLNTVELRKQATYYFELGNALNRSRALLLVKLRATFFSVRGTVTNTISTRITKFTSKLMI
jgi:hypothetical protein